MIKKEIIEDGLIKKYSDSGYYIQNPNGDLYPEAIDIDDIDYIETDIPLEDEEEATVDDYKAIVLEMLGL